MQFGAEILLFSSPILETPFRLSSGYLVLSLLPGSTLADLST
jgi:hypothetical protein